MSTIPEAFEGSPALALLTEKNWSWRTASEPNIEVETCPYCKHGNYHLRMEIQGTQSPNPNRDGLHNCMRCGKGGNLTSLKQHLGLAASPTSTGGGRSGYSSTGNTERKKAELPDVEAAHTALLEDAEVLDYLMNVRGFSQKIIEQQKLGIVPKHWFREAGEVKALVYPYLVNGNPIFVHYRTLPPSPKAFSSPTGWAVPLYNGEALNNEDLKDVIFVEGEPDCIAALDHGITDICGVPGANIKKAEWIDSLERLERIYICYDNDKVGQKAAQELANRIGIEKCWKITLDFKVVVDGVERQGKDLNEYFTIGGYTAEDFLKLKEKAELFDVAGVASAEDAIQEFEDELDGKAGLEPKYRSQWPTQNNLLGFDDGDVIDILAPEKVGKTTYALNLLEHMVSTYGEDGVFICLEMTRDRMARKYIAYKAQIEDNIPKNVEEAMALKAEFKAASPEVRAELKNREGNLLFCYPKYKSVDDIYDLMRDCIRRYGVKWIVIDNIQRLCDTTLPPKKNRTEHLSEISKVTSQIAKDYDVQMIRILQPHRIQGGKIASSDNVDGASQIAKDCDCMIILHRERLGGDMTVEEAKEFVYEEATFSDDMLVTVGLSRYSGGGRTTLHYNGATSTILEKDMGQIAKMNARNKREVGYAAINAALKLNEATPAANTTDDEVINV